MQMQTKLTATLLAAAVLAAPSALACVTVKVDNQTDRQIRAVWTAAGCLGADKKSKVAFKCAGHDIPAGTSRSHDFDWGKSGQAVTFYYDGVGKAEGMKVQVSFSYQSSSGQYEKTWGLRKIPGTPGGCGRHFTVPYTNEDVRADSESTFLAVANETKHHEW